MTDETIKLLQNTLFIYTIIHSEIYLFFCQEQCQTEIYTHFFNTKTFGLCTRDVHNLKPQKFIKFTLIYFLVLSQCC